MSLIDAKELIRLADPGRDVDAMSDAARRSAAQRLRRRYGINAVKKAPHAFFYDLREVKRKLPHHVIPPRP